ncbi:MAG: non-heme iron oxygenase ferredoxin subunit [Calditrichia bacterium]
MSDWIEVMSVETFSGPCEVVEVEGYSIALFRLNDGYYAIDDECSHDVASLGEGEIVEECKIECPKHGALFDIKTGESLTLPAVVGVKSYPVKIEDGMILVNI